MSKLENVSVDVKANVYFDGKVVSHSAFDTAGHKKTLGLIYPGTFTFDTGKAECMTITAGTCMVLLKGEGEWKIYGTGTEFKVPANSSFDIKVQHGITEYLCEFLEP